MTEFLFGAVALAFAVVALYFVRFWRETREVLFLLFAISFAVQAASQTALAVDGNVNEARPAFYIPRLVAYALIVVGIISKNRRRRIPHVSVGANER